MNSILDIELYYKSKGSLIPPALPPKIGEPCLYRPNNRTTSRYLDNSINEEYLRGVLFAVRVGISSLTILTLGLVWWYQELERRLLVVRHHLSQNVPLLCSPLMTSFVLELTVNLIHLPPGIQRSPPEFQLFVFIRIYHVVKYLREHHPMRYHRMTEILKTISSVKLSSTFLLKVDRLMRKKYKMHKLFFTELLSQKAIIHVMFDLHFQCLRRWVHCLCSG